VPRPHVGNRGLDERSKLRSVDRVGGPDFHVTHEPTRLEAIASAAQLAYAAVGAWVAIAIPLRLDLR
jgi:hypothetical protein